MGEPARSRNWSDICLVESGTYNTITTNGVAAPLEYISRLSSLHQFPDQPVPATF